MYSTNQIDTPVITWGTLWASGIVTPANPNYTVDEFSFQLKDSGAKAIATTAELLPKARESAKAVGIPEDRIILIGDNRVKGFAHFKELVDSSTIMKWRKGKINPEKDIAYLVYSSGTTGLPKGVMLSHKNVASNVKMLMAGEHSHLDWRKDKIIAFLPFFHIYGLTCLLHHSMYSGRTLVVMERFDLEKFCRLVQELRITYAYVVPPVVLLLAKHPIVEKYDLSSLRMMNSGAAPLTEELVHSVYNRIKVPVKQGYGLSETAPVTHTQDWDTWKTHIGSVGRLLPNQEVKYLDLDGKEIPTGETGEICIRGPNVMLGYWNNPTATKATMTDDGFFRTGDVGHEDKDGNLYITDRVKELIKYKGFQVPPAELEGKLVAHEDIDDCAVVGVYDEKIASEAARAYIVLRPGVNPEGMEKKIYDWLAARVAHHKRLHGGVRFVDAIPKSAAGKILRRKLKEMAKEEQAKSGMNAKAKL